MDSNKIEHVNLKFQLFIWICPKSGIIVRVSFMALAYTSRHTLAWYLKIYDNCFILIYFTILKSKEKNKRLFTSHFLLVLLWQTPCSFSFYSISFQQYTKATEKTLWLLQLCYDKQFLFCSTSKNAARLCFAYFPVRGKAIPVTGREGL
jgi:hypothetical protein